jgi:repressor LexA
MLTPKQHELLVYIHKHLQDSGISPSFDEMKDAVKLRSKSGVHRLITGLVERGFIRRLEHRARALEVLRLPSAAVPKPISFAERVSATRRKFSPNVIQGRFAMGTGAAKKGDSERVSLPLLGRIAAGTPIEALRDNSNFIEVPAGWLGTGEHYALEISGDSMTGAGINEGDTAIIERCETVESGAIVVALIDNQEATLKRLRRRGNSIALEAANPAYETRIFGPDRVKVQGRLVGLWRRY